MKTTKFEDIRSNIVHKRILLSLDRDQFKFFDYTADYAKNLESLGGNSGNNVFQYCLQKILTNDNNEVTIDTEFLHRSIDFNKQKADYINNNFDCVVFSPANIIANYAKTQKLPMFIKRMSMLKIPIYAIGLGAQSDRQYSMDFLLDIKDLAFEYIKTILNSGGRIGLRGYFTAEVVKKLGFTDSDFSVIGCPSLFMNGSNLKVVKPTLNEYDLHIAINGFRAWNNPLCAKYLVNNKNSFFVCQDEFYKLLYNTLGYGHREYQYLADSDNKWLNCYNNDSIKLYGDFQSWYNDLKNKNINFSFGCRVHGNIVPILAGIPAYIDVFDSRVRELAEFFDIPCGYLDEGFNDPYGLYQKADYTNFNKNFAQKFDNFRNFMDDCGLNIAGTLSKIPADYILPKVNNQKYICTLASKLSKAKKIAFVAHEFGLYSGHGGIASYLYNICSWLLKLPNIEIFVYASYYGNNTDLLQNTRFNIIKLNGNLEEQRDFVFRRLIEVQPDYIEFAEFNALGLKTVIEKKLNNIDELQHSTIVTNNHTATKECWEWSNLKNFALAPYYLQNVSNEEAIQMHLSDYCIAPSSFLADYVKKNYHLENQVLVFANPYITALKTKDRIRREMEEVFDLNEFNNSFNIVLISRFEGRKQQKKLIMAIKKLIDEELNINLIMAGNSTTMSNGIDYREYLMQFAGDTKNIYFFDFANLETQEKFVAIADLTVMPSTFENQPVAMIETVLREIPVMGSIYSGITDYTKDERLLFNPFKENDLTDKIRDFYHLSKNERISIQKAQKKRLEEFIDPEKSILDRINLKPINKRYNYEENMRTLIK